MDAQTVVLAFGGLLILLGLVGGGFTIKGVALPKIQNVARTLSVIIGLILILLGILGFQEDAQPTGDEPVGNVNSADG